MVHYELQPALARAIQFNPSSSTLSQIVVILSH